MIATVLLVAFTVAVGGILSLWLTSLTTTTTGNVENITTDQTKCSTTWINVLSVTSNAILLNNLGNQMITNINCWSDLGVNVSTSGGMTLNPGASSSIVWGRGTNVSVTCTGKCLTIGVTGECESGQTCWKV
jgi:hypothetical protein